MSTEVPTIQTGIYRSSEGGDLYFVEGLEQDSDSSSLAHLHLRVRYHALYPGAGMPLSRSLVGLNRFELVQALSVEKMHMLLPGSLVCRIDDDPVTESYRQVEKVSEQNGTILIEMRSWGKLPLNSFFQLYTKVSK